MANFYKKFIGLIPVESVLVGDVVAHDGVVATVELPGGGVVLARGEATVGQRVFVRAGAIDGLAPSLPYFEVEE